MHEFDVINNADSCLIPEETTAESQLHQQKKNKKVKWNKLTLQCISLEVHYESNHTLPTVFVSSLVTESVTSADNKTKSYSILTARL